MDSPNTLFSLTHTTTSSQTHTMTLLHGDLEGDGEDAGEADHRGEDDLGFLGVSETALSQTFCTLGMNWEERAR